MACQYIKGYFMPKGKGILFIIRSNFFAYDSIVYKLFLNRPIWPTDLNLSSTTTSDQSGPGSNDNEGIHHTPPKLQNLLPHHQ